MTLLLKALQGLPIALKTKTHPPYHGLQGTIQYGLCLLLQPYVVTLFLALNTAEVLKEAKLFSDVGPGIRSTQEALHTLFAWTFPSGLLSIISLERLIMISPI